METLKKAAMILFSISLGLALIEGFLRLSGRYEDLAVGGVNASNSTIWTRPFSVRQKHKHPDLNYEIDVIYDESGVRNLPA